MKTESSDQKNPESNSYKVMMNKLDDSKPIDIGAYHYAKCCEYFENFYNNKSANHFNELYLACQHLITSYQLGNIDASFKTSRFERKMLWHEQSQALDNEFYGRLERYYPSSRDYLGAQTIKCILNFSKSQHTIYSNYGVRWREIRRAFDCVIFNENVNLQELPLNTAAFFKKTILNFPNHTDRNINEATWDFLINELLGYDILGDLVNETEWGSVINIKGYPFKLIPREKLLESLSIAYKSSPPGTLSNVVDRIEIQRKKIADLILCKPTIGNGYDLKISAKQLLTNPKSLICYVDENTNTEIARFKLADNQIHFTAYSSAITLSIDGTINDKFLTFENPRANLTLRADMNAERLYLSGEAKHFVYSGHMNGQEVTIDVRGVLEIAKDAKIQSTTELKLRADGIGIKGKLFSNSICHLESSTILLMAPKSECLSRYSTILSTRMLKDVCGRIVSNGLVKVKNLKCVYLDGTAQLHQAPLNKNPIEVKLNSAQRRLLKSSEYEIENEFITNIVENNESKVPGVKTSNKTQMESIKVKTSEEKEESKTQEDNNDIKKARDFQIGISKLYRVISGAIHRYENQVNSRSFLRFCFKQNSQRVKSVDRLSEKLRNLRELSAKLDLANVPVYLSIIKLTMLNILEQEIHETYKSHRLGIFSRMIGSRSQLVETYKWAVSEINKVADSSIKLTRN